MSNQRFAAAQTAIRIRPLERTVDFGHFAQQGFVDAGQKGRAFHRQRAHRNRLIAAQSRQRRGHAPQQIVCPRAIVGDNRQLPQLALAERDGRRLFRRPQKAV